MPPPKGKVPNSKSANKLAVKAPSVRLVAPNVTGDYQGSLALQKPPLSPSVRLATGVGPPDAFAKGMVHPNPKKRIQGLAQLEHIDPATVPALLVSFYYLAQFMENRKRYYFRDWVMDSGAFSAYASGAVIDLEAYIDKCHELMETDPALTEIYALDVIGDWRASEKNTEYMWSRGVPAIPCYHYGEPDGALRDMAKHFPKIALGGVAALKEGGRNRKEDWARACFGLAYEANGGPKKIHGFAYNSEKTLMRLPFHSVDATNWEIAPCKFGVWKSLGGQRCSVRGSQQNLRPEVEHYLKLEAKLRVKWKSEMEKMEAHPAAPGPPHVRLSDGAGGRGVTVAEAFVPPSVRLAETASGKTGAKVRAFAGVAGRPVPVSGEAVVPAPAPKLPAPSVRLAEGGEGNSPGSNRVEKRASAFKPKRLP